jgi:putative solute:sodium symporter small subunit
MFSGPAAQTGREQRQHGGAAPAGFRCLRTFTSVPPHGPIGTRRQRTMAPPDSLANQEEHWRKTSNLMWVHLGIWIFFGYVVHMFVVPLNKIIIPVIQFPLGFYMAGQGSLIVFVVMLFVFARQQDKIDRDHGYAEDV